MSLLHREVLKEFTKWHEVIRIQFFRLPLLARGFSLSEQAGNQPFSQLRLHSTIQLACYVVAKIAPFTLL
jgi:hypothetical protein